MEVKPEALAGKERKLEDLGRRIARLRRERRWTQADLAQCIGVARERLGHWEQGKHTPPLKFMVRLVRTFQISLDEMVMGECLTNDETREARWHVAALNRLLAGELASRSSLRDTVQRFPVP
ncbi:MAG TPA: helix-turn-helix transcriptional regulator [Thermoanaerobaculia bacterium]|nr:helix-turn-helix transcriptional regulator [Thermoanaerobaculia bacterium]